MFDRAYVRDREVNESSGRNGSSARWQAIAESPEFRRLEALRRRGMLVSLSIFAAVFGSFLVLCGYARPFMSKSVDGGLTVAYVWILALTLVAWVLVWAYLRFAGRLESKAQEFLRRSGYEEEER
jgi:uncharacterized membrane protein (DUF485 family)